MRRRREWFQHLDEPFLVLWWVRAGHIPSMDEAVAKLERLRRNGPSAEAFTFHEPFDPPGGQVPKSARTERTHVAGSASALGTSSK